MLPSAAARGIDNFLREKGFTEAPLRAIIAAEFALLSASLLAGLLMLWLTAWFLCFAVGVALFCLNFWGMSGFALRVMADGFSRRTLGGQMLRLGGRLALSGFSAAFVLLAGGSAPALCLGFLASLALMSAVGLTRRDKN